MEMKWFVCAACMLFVSPFQAQGAGTPMSGDGRSSASAFLIETPAQLCGLAKAVNGGADQGVYYRLANDIDLSQPDGAGFVPIGLGAEPALHNDNKYFNGIFDGNGKTVRGLNIDMPTSDNVGLFGGIGVCGVVCDLTLEGGSVRGKANVGALAGYNGGKIERCKANVNVESVEDSVGGLIGDNGGKVMECEAAGTVKGLTYAGGLVGYNRQSAEVSNSSATGAVTGLKTIETMAGGLIGENYGLVDTCKASGTVKGTFLYGPFIGYNNDKVSAVVKNCDGAIANK